MKALIKHQTLRIDSHQRGDGQELNWEHVHLHKITNLKVEGKTQDLQIEVPLNADLEPRIYVGAKRRLDNVPHSLLREVEKALENPQKRSAFVGEVLNVLNGNFGHYLSDEEAFSVIRRISKFFDLDWQDDFIKKEVIHSWGRDLFTATIRDSKDDTCYSLSYSPQYMELIAWDTMKKNLEDVLPRYIIADKGTADRGKSTSIIKTFEKLSEIYPTEILAQGSEIKAIITINGTKVGIESMGDPNSRMPKTMDKFVKEGCRIILTACRTKNETCNKVYELFWRYGYNIIWAPNIGTEEHIEGIDNHWNEIYANNMADFIEKLADGKI